MKFLKFKKRLKAESGFTLTEVMIAVMILTVAIVSSTSLLVGLINTNRSNVQTLQAYYLAQEGVELMRNVRDTNWLYNVDWLHGLEKNEGFAINLRDPRNVGIGVFSYDGSSAAGAGASAALDSILSAFSPWEVLNGFSNSEIKVVDEVFLSSVGGEGDVSTGFLRTLTVSDYPDCDFDDCSDFVLVESKVTWDGQGKERVVLINEVLTNWKGGAL